MDYRIEERRVPSSDGLHTLSGRVYIPNGEIRGIFHLVHGMTEYIERFDRTMSTVAKAGFVCFGYDNLGHGKTVSNDSELGFIAEKDGWKFLVRDVKRFSDSIRQEFPNLPVILMGHSMGSFIARLAAENYGDGIEKLIICGTGGPNAAAPFGLLLTDSLKLFKGGHGYSSLAQNAAFGTYNKRFEGRTKFDWLTKNTAVIDKYIEDKYCNFPFTVSGLHDLVKLNIACNRADWYKKLRRDLPVLLISGADDPVGNYGKGVEKVYNRLVSTGHTNVRIRLYENCRHEIHNDTCADEVLTDILSFITA